MDVINYSVYSNLKSRKLFKEYNHTLKQTEWKERFYRIDPIKNQLIEDKKVVEKENPDGFKFTERNIIYFLRNVKCVHPPKKLENGGLMSVIEFVGEKDRDLKLRGDDSDVKEFYLDVLKCLQ